MNSDSIWEVCNVIWLNAETAQWFDMVPNQNHDRFLYPLSFPILKIWLFLAILKSVQANICSSVKHTKPFLKWIGSICFFTGQRGRWVVLLIIQKNYVGDL